MRIVRFLILALSIKAADAWAAGKATGSQSKEADWRAREKVAKKACATENYREGVGILADLLIETNDPVYIHNQGRCYQQNGRYEAAIERFREYLRKANQLSDAERASIEGYIADCQQVLSQSARTSPVTSSQEPPPPPLSASTAPLPAVPTPVAPPVAEATSATTQSPPGAGLRTAGIVTAGVGTASVVLGLVLNLQANNLASEVNQHYSRSKESTHSSYQTYAWVSYGIGAAAILAGATMYAIGLGGGGSSSRPEVTISPIVTSRATGVLVGGSF